MTADHKAALKDAKRIVKRDKYYLDYERNVSAAYIELRELAKAACDAHDPNWMPTLRAAIGEE